MQDDPAVHLQLPESCDALHVPLDRPLRRDMIDPSREELLALAVARALHAARPDLTTVPPVLFPNAESFQARFFSEQDWRKFGNLEAEEGRVKLMLSSHPERLIPIGGEQALRTLAASPNIFAAWKRLRSEFKTLGMHTIGQLIRKMSEARRALQTDPKINDVTGKEKFLATPLTYKTMGACVQEHLSCWNHALDAVSEQFATGNQKGVTSFLEIHALLKDPVGGLNRDFSEQTAEFKKLLHAVLESSDPTRPFDRLEWRAIAAQLALESSFLSIKKARKIEYVHFAGHQQLPYVYVTLDKLPRAEFSLPDRVLELVMQMISESEGGKLPDIAPIAISYCPPLEQGKKLSNVIIDGNNRVTAIMLLRLLASCDARPADETLARFCSDHGLNAKWQADLGDSMSRIAGFEELRDYFAEHASKVASFKNVTRVPALLVQESSFYTLSTKRSANLSSKITLLQPVHQALYNDRKRDMAIPAKEQSHGRSLGFKKLPVK